MHAARAVPAGTEIRSLPGGCSQRLGAVQGLLRSGLSV